jgi:pimeloyl-ACP methyl ester carboxylesterase
LSWEPCRAGEGPSGYQCASLEVPLDPADPAKGNIALALDRRPAGAKAIGSLLVNPGGPGASGVDFLPEAVSMMPASLLSRFNVVGFDPPGVGHSDPITCGDPAQLSSYFNVDPAPLSQAGLDELISADRAFAQGCERLSGRVLPYVSTVDAARDMDLIRHALGDPKLNYLGFSYGTYLGAVYAELFPTKVRAMVLDGALDPGLPAITQVDQQAASLQGQLMQFFSACGRDSSCPWHPGADPAAAYQALLDRVRRHPLPVLNSSAVVGPAAFLYGSAAALYDPSTWIDLAEALAQASQGNGTFMAELFDLYVGRRSNGTYSNVQEANAAVNCLDAPSPSLAQIEQAAPKAEALGGALGLLDLYSLIGCDVWPVPASGTNTPIHAPGSPPIVVVGSTGDPITPYAWAKALAAQLPQGVLLTRVGDGHTAYRSSACIRSYVDAYLISLKVPPAGTTCASN